MGVQLFIRGTRKIALTNEGMLLRRRAEEILELVDKTERELVEQEEELEGVVSIGGGDLKAMQLLPEIVERFREKYPKVTFELYTATADHIKDRIDRGLTDIGILLEPINIDKYDFIRLNQKEKWVVSMHPNDPLAKTPYVTADDLIDVPLILPHRLNVQSELANWFGNSYEKLNVAFKSNLPTSSSLMVRNRLAYAITVTGSIELWDKEKITYRPLYPELTATSVMAWKRHQPFGKAAEKFIEHLKVNLSGK